VAGRDGFVMKKLKPLIIGDLEIKVPIVQGGMGVKISTASLASAVANCGGAGTLASVGLGDDRQENRADYPKASREGLIYEIRQTKKSTKGIFGVNIMVALSNYEDLVSTTVKQGVDFIVSGAGLPLRLPELTEGTKIKLIPIVSSARAADIIIKTWQRRYNRIPDAIVVEGPLAGGHLGFKYEDIMSRKTDLLENITKDVITLVKNLGLKIPVIAGGGIYDGTRIADFLKLGASGVQIATPFVTTFECSVPDNFKELYLTAKEEDILIIASPVGMPGRALRTKFIDGVMKGEKRPISCNYICLKTCDPHTAPYCIAEAMFNAAIGDLDNAIVFTGAVPPKIKRIISVNELMDTLVNGALEGLNTNGSQEHLFTVKELADYLKMQPITIYKHAEQGKLPSFKVGASWRFKKATIDKWIEEQEKTRYNDAK